jgi:hypothetical protein
MRTTSEEAARRNFKAQEEFFLEISVVSLMTGSVRENSL